MPAHVALDARQEAELVQKARQAGGSRQSSSGPNRTIDEINALLRGQYGPQFPTQVGGKEKRLVYYRVAVAGNAPGVPTALSAPSGELEIPLVALVEWARYNVAPVPISGLKFWIKWEKYTPEGPMFAEYTRRSPGYYIVPAWGRERPDLDGEMARLKAALPMRANKSTAVCGCPAANPTGYSVWPWVIGYAVVGGVIYYFLTRKTYAASEQGATAPGYGTPALPPPPTAKKCPFPLDKPSLNKWLDANGLFGFFSPTCPPPHGYLELVKITNGAVNNVQPGESLVAICEDTGDFWFYAGPGSTPVLRSDLRASYCKSIGVTGLAPAMPSFVFGG